MRRHWIFKTAAVMWVALGAVSAVLPFLPAKLSERFYGLDYLPKWHWHVWVIGLLIITIAAVFEGGHRQIESLKATHAARMQELEAEGLCTPNLWLDFGPNTTTSDDRTLRIQNSGGNPVFDVVVKIPCDGSCFNSDPISRLQNDTSWVTCKANRAAVDQRTVRGFIVEEMLRGAKDEIPVLISFREHPQKQRDFRLVIRLPLRDGIQFALPREKR